MTKILIDRATVEQALEALELAYDYTGQDTESGRELCREARVAAKALRAALARQAEPVQEPVADEWAKLLHYPDCWDTAAYPTLHDAVHEALAWSGCSVCKLEQQAEPVQEPVLVVEKEPDYWCRGHFHQGSKPHIDPTKVWNLPIGTKLYTTPPQRKPLSEEEIRIAFRKAFPVGGVLFTGDAVSFVRAVEAAHGIKEGK